MGRSVDYASNAACVVFFPFEVEDEFDSSWEWSELKADICEVISSKYPSFCEDGKWVGRELERIMANDFAEVIIAEYCGLVSVSLRVREFETYYADEASKENLANGWANRISENWAELMNKSFGGLRKLGTFSNGESVYESIAA